MVIGFTYRNVRWRIISRRRWKFGTSRIQIFWWHRVIKWETLQREWKLWIASTDLFWPHEHSAITRTSHSYLTCTTLRQRLIRKLRHSMLTWRFQTTQSWWLTWKVVWTHCATNAKISLESSPRMDPITTPEPASHASIPKSSPIMQSFALTLKPSTNSSCLLFFSQPSCLSFRAPYSSFVREQLSLATTQKWDSNASRPKKWDNQIWDIMVTTTSMLSEIHHVSLLGPSEVYFLNFSNFRHSPSAGYTRRRQSNSPARCLLTAINSFLNQHSNFFPVPVHSNLRFQFRLHTRKFSFILKVLQMRATPNACQFLHSELSKKFPQTHHIHNISSLKSYKTDFSSPVSGYEAKCGLKLSSGFSVLMDLAEFFIRNAASLISPQNGKFMRHCWLLMSMMTKSL